jgi:hypothetical protein
MRAKRTLQIFIGVATACVILCASIALPSYLELLLFATGFLCAVGSFVCGLIHISNNNE